MKTSPRVSVLIPTYNYGEFLDDAIQSVLAQTFTDFELIITDNRSTDQTEEIVQKYLNDKRVFYYKNPTNIGMVPNFNKAIELSKGEYIKFLMADDMFRPEMLEKYVAIMDKYPQVSIVTSYKKFFGLESVKQDPNFPPPALTGLQNGKKVIYESLNTWNWIGEPTTVMYRRSNSFVGNYNSDYGWFPDWDLWIRHLCVGDCYIIPEVLSDFRQHENQCTVNVRKNFSKFFEEYRFFKNLKLNNPYQIDLSKIDIDKIIKVKAANCTKLSIKIIPKLGERKNWSVLNQALKVAYKERVLLGLF